MYNRHDTHFFLGANSPRGFESLYGGFVNAEQGDKLYIIKGGPGCGKSSFMKKLGAGMEKLGARAEYIHCSGDPGSLDGVRFPELGIAYVDGTAPHIAEPKYPGAAESYVNLGMFYDNESLYPHLSEIAAINASYKALYSKAYGLLDAAYHATLPFYSQLESRDVVQYIRRRAAGISSRELKRIPGRTGRQEYRYLSALTCNGRMCLFDTVSALAQRVYIIGNGLGLSHLMLDELAAAAAEKGYDSIVCVSPLEGRQTEHLIIPSLSLAFLSSTSGGSYSGSVYRHIRLDSAPPLGSHALEKAQLKKAVKLSAPIYDQAISILKDAKELHDKLEAVYNSHVDFSGVYALAEEHLTALTRKYCKR